MTWLIKLILIGILVFLIYRILSSLHRAISEGESTRKSRPSPRWSNQRRLPTIGMRTVARPRSCPSGRATVLSRDMGDT